MHVSRIIAFQENSTNRKSQWNWGK